MKLHVEKSALFKGTQYTLDEDLEIRLSIPDRLFLDHEPHEVLNLVREAFSRFVDQLREQLR